MVERWFEEPRGAGSNPAVPAKTESQRPPSLKGKTAEKEVLSRGVHGLCCCDYTLQQTEFAEAPNLAEASVGKRIYSLVVR